MRLCRGQRILHGDAAGETECELGAVDAMIAAVDKCHAAVDDLKTKRPLAHRFDDAFLHCRNPLFRYRSTVNFFFKEKSQTTRQRLHLNDDVTELAVATRLLLVATLLSHWLAD